MRLRWREPVDNDDLQPRAGTVTGSERPSGVFPSGRVTASTDPATAQTKTNSCPVRSLRRRNTSCTGINQGQRSTDDSTTRNRRSRVKWQVTQQTNERRDLRENGVKGKTTCLLTSWQDHMLAHLGRHNARNARNAEPH
jgi:hypothetical protein